MSRRSISLVGRDFKLFVKNVWTRGMESVLEKGRIDWNLTPTKRLEVVFYDSSSRLFEVRKRMALAVWTVFNRSLGREDETSCSSGAERRSSATSCKRKHVD